MLTFLLSCNELSVMEKIAHNIIRSIRDCICIFYATSGSEALDIIRSKKQIIDIFFIDVNLKEFGGYRLESEIRKMNRYKETPIIFITKVSYNLIGFSDLSTYQAYKKHNYISLPINDLDVQGIIGLYLDNIISEKINKESNNKTLVFKHSKGYIKLNIQRIIFIEVQNKCCKLHTSKGEYLLKGISLNNLQLKINSDSFVKCHRSYILNINHISSIEKISKKNWVAHFNNHNETCPISIAYGKDVYNKYKE